MTEAKAQLLRKRYNAERRFKLYGQIAIALALMFLAVFMYKIFSKGYTAFQKTWIQTEVHYDQDLMLIEGPNPTLQDLEDADYYLSLIHISEPTRLGRSRMPSSA